MKKFENFELALQALKDQHVILFLAPQPTFCILHDQKVTLINQQSHLKIPLVDFELLYCDEVFYLSEQRAPFEIDEEKDSEYYSLRYK